LFQASALTATEIQLLSIDPEGIDAQLKALSKTAPNFFDYTAVIIDLTILERMDLPLTLQVLIDLLRSHKLVPIGMRTHLEKNKTLAKEHGLAVFQPHRTVRDDTPNQAAAEHKETPPQHEPSTSTKHVALSIDGMVRSGKQIYAKDCDLVIIGSVSPGAEVIADGNIHIYGHLQGRALAGAAGDAQARIFCAKLDAELIAIAGYYLTSEQIEQRCEKNKGGYRIQLDDEQMIIKTPIGKR
jgi:septum site-determining protein MinC